MEIFPFHKQETNYTCGAASMRMALAFCKIKKSEKQITKLLGTNKTRGTLDKSFPIVAENFKLNYISMRNAEINDMKKYNNNGFVIIVCYFCPLENSYHYSVIKSIGTKYIYFYDPYFGKKHYYPLSIFKKIWKSDPKYDKEKRWFFAIKK